MEELPDVQTTKPNIPISIMQVGVENVEVPFLLESKYGGFNSMVANVSMRTNLDSNTKGISMSRLLLTLQPYLDLPLKSKLIKEILKEILKNVGSSAAYMKFEFRLPIKRKSVVSDNEFPIYYKCRFEGQLLRVPTEYPLGTEVEDTDYFKFYQGVIIQYSSYCPCSAELCENKGVGFPHNQRSFANILVQGDQGYYTWLEDIIDLVENAVHTVPYPIVKRGDEKYIAGMAKSHPQFVEDSIREISHRLGFTKDIIDWFVKCTHEESIHTSNAIAINWKGKMGGFDETTYI